MIPAISSPVSSAPMQRLREELSRLQKSPCTPVLLVGPPGAGKQHTAELLHRESYENAKSAPFVMVDCAALGRDVVDSELFGHERGALASANGGSLFLHEVTALPLSAQVMLLKFLDGMRLRRLGAERDVELSLRVIGSSCREPRALVKSGQLHEDLYRRLSVFRVNVPSLQERRDELDALSQQFVEHFAARMRKEVTGLAPDARSLLGGYSFPGNVRELRTIIERAVISARGPLLSGKDLAIGDSSWSEPTERGRFFELDTYTDGVPPPLDVVEQAYVRRVLEHTGGKRMAAAQLLGISYPTFLKRLRELGVEDAADSGPRSAAAAPAGVRRAR
jgi:two-component system, NtrC family, response regulator AtoC